MADLDITQMTQLAVAPATDDILYIGDVSEAVLADQNKHIEIENLFQYLDGGYQSDIVLDTSATLDLTLGAVHLNEAVDLVATSTELNQLDGVTVGGTGSGDIITIDGTQTLTNKTLTTPTIGSFTNATHDHADAAGGGNTLAAPTITDLTNMNHTHAGASNGGQLTSPLVNEAVALVATATELNQLDGVTVGGTSAGDIVDLDTAQTLGSKTLTTPTIGDFTNATHTHEDASEGGTLTYSVSIPVFAATAAVTTGEKGIIVIPAIYNGLDLTAVVCGVWDKGITGTTDIGIYRSRAGSEIAMLSTEVTIGDEWYAQDGVINTSNDDVATGDIINVNISGIHSGTAPNGLTVTLEFS